MAAINLNIGGDTRQLERDIQKTVNRAYAINLKTKGEQPLGRITGKVNEFEKSLAASNARVIAFGASAGIIFGVQSAFVSLAKSVVDVQKSLQDINVILNVSTAQLNKFGANLFDIAKNTGQSFQEVANAATEFSRQGLGVEETLKRTNEALILSRLSGLDTVKSVEALTAAVNSFASQAVTATQIVNKFATVDAAFAVSSADLADALARVGSSAAQSGVSLDELIAIVTSAQQTTARGGAVIGNSLKTIFTRLQREKVVNLLESLGVTTTGAGGELKSTIDLLEDLAVVYDNLGTQQQAYVAEQVGGVFQINILKAALADLGKEYSIYNSALKISATATDQAIKRNEELNKTFAAQLNALQQNITQFGGNIGERLLTPLFDRTVGNLNELLGGINESEANGFGATLGKGILDGLGQVIAGPGLALIGGVLIKLFKDFSVYASGSLKDLLGLNNASKQQAELQRSISQIISKNPELYALMQKGASGLNQASQILLQNLKAQTLELQTQQKLSATIAKQFYGAGVRVKEGIPTIQSPKGVNVRSNGFIPNFSVQSELTGIKKSHDYTSSQKKKAAGDIRTANFPGLGPTIYNGAETIAPSTVVAQALGYPKGTKPKNPAEKYSILTPAMADNLNIAAKGFVPNFVNERLGIRGLAGKSNKFNIERYIKTPPIDYDIEGNSTPTILAGRVFESKIRKERSVNLVENRPGADIISPPWGPAEAKLSLGAALRDKNIVNKSMGRLVVPQSSKLSGSDFEKITQKGINVSPYPLTHSYLFKVAKAMIEQNKNKVVNPRSIPIPFASGFIPNFAQTAAQSNKVVELGDTTTNPLFRGKVSSLIYPQVSENKSKAQAETTYLGKKYRGLVSIAGINKKALKGEIPDLEANLDQLLLREANEFGRAIGGTEFLQSASELPNIGAAKGAVGVSFEGGLLTLLKRDIQKSAQNARIDFTQDRINTKFKSLFHGAPGTYEAKYSPSLTGEVLQKMLRGAGVGQVAQPKSGPLAGASMKQREAVLASINKDVAEGKITQPRRGNALEAEIRRRLPLMFPGAVKGAAAGFIPNFAAQQIAEVMALETAMSGEKAIFDTKPFPHVRNKSQPTFGSAMADHGGKNKALKDSLMGQKSAGIIKASGFIPNFAVDSSDTGPENLGASVAAIGTQLGSLALILSLNKDSLNSSLEEMIGKQKLASGMTVADAKLRQQAIKEEIAASQGNVQKIKKLQGEYDKLSTQIGQTRNRGDVTTATRGQKFAAGVSANTLGITFIAPIIAETVANAIGQGSKEARASSAGVSGLGQAASFAATGALIAGPWGAAIGGAIGGVTTLTSIIKEASTDIPELTAAANQSSQALTKLNDASNTISTGFSNLLQLRDSGKNKEAATAEASLINEIQKTFKDNPALATQAISAVKSSDFEMLSKALGENTKAVMDKNIQDQRNLSTGTFKEEVTGIRRANFMGGRENYGFTRQEAQQFGESFKKNILDVSNVGTGQIQGKELQDLDKQINQIVGNEQANPEVLSNLFSKIGMDFEKTGIQGNQEIRLAFSLLQAEINRRAQIERDASTDTEENNARLRAINQALNKAYSQYQQLAKNAAASAKFEFDLANQRRELSVEFGKTVLEGRSQVAETLGVSSAGQRGIANQERVLEIDETFNKTVNDSLGEVNATFADFKSQLIESRITEIQKGTDIEAKTALGKAETRAAQIQTIAPEFEFFGQNVENAIQILDQSIQESLKTGSAVNLSAFEQAISAGINTEDKEVAKKLAEVIASADETVKLAIKAEQTRKAQLAILAQQNINQIAQEFAKATVDSFGGFAKEFLGKDIGDKSMATEISDVAIQRQNYVDALDRAQAEGGGPMTEQQRQELGRLSGNVYSAIESIVGRPLGLDENNPLRQQEIQGRASQITEQFNQIRAEAGGDPEVLGAINQAEMKLAEQTGFIDEYNKIISTAQNPTTTEEQANIEAAGGPEQWARAALDELFQKVALKTATVQSNELRKTGDLETTFLEAAAKTLNPEQQAALKEAGAAGQELFKDPAILMQNQLVKTDETNTILGQIRDEIAKALLTPNANGSNPAFNFGSDPGQVPLPTFNTTVSPTVNINMNGGAGGTQVNAEGMSAETAKVLEENKDRILAAGGLADKVANLEDAIYSQFPDRRPPPRISREERGG